MKSFECLFFSLSLVAVSSCSQENDVIAPVDQMPEGMVLSQIKIKTPNPIRSRADNMLPLWGLFDDWDGKSDGLLNNGRITLQYAVYDNDGNLYAQYIANDPVKAGTVLTSGESAFNISVALPPNAEGFKIFCWADKGYAYNFDPISKTISYNDNSSSYMSVHGDAFFYWGELKPGQNEVSLKRPFVQVNLLTNDHLSESDWQDGIGADCGLMAEDNDNFRYVPYIWHFDTDTFEMLKVDSNNLPNRSFNPRSVLSSVCNGRQLAYAGCFYLFAPQTRRAWVDETTKTSMSRIGLYIYNDDNTQANLFLQGNIPLMKANTRLNIFTDGGLFPGNFANIHGTIDEIYSDNIDMELSSDNFTVKPPY